MPSAKEVLSLLRETGALLQGHFKLSSGLHSPQYVQCALVLSFPPYAESLAESLAGSFKEDKIDLVVGPAMGGIILSQEMGRALKARAIFAERLVCHVEQLSAVSAQAGGTGREKRILSLRRGFEIKKGEKVLVAEDVVTTGGSVRETIEIVEREGGIVKGVVSLIDRSSGKVDFGVKWEALVKLDIQTYPPDQCPLCRKSIPLEKLGSR